MTAIKIHNYFCLYILNKQTPISTGLENSLFFVQLVQTLINVCMNDAKIKFAIIIVISVIFSTTLLSQMHLQSSIMIDWESDLFCVMIFRIN